MILKLAKSEQTLQAIIRTAMQIATSEGLQRVTLGEVAKRMHISKSGVFARVGSLETLQREVIAEFGRVFNAAVFMPALDAPRGLPRLNAIMRAWIGRGSGDEALAGGLFTAAAVSLDPTTQSLREPLMASLTTWREQLARAVRMCIDEGHLQTNTDPAQVVFELSSLMVGFLHDTRFVRDPLAQERTLSAYERLINSYKPA